MLAHVILPYVKQQSYTLRCCFPSYSYRICINVEEATALCAEGCIEKKVGAMQVSVKTHTAQTSRWHLFIFINISIQVDFPVLELNLFKIH